MTDALKSKIMYVRFEVLMVMNIDTVFWVVTLCSLAGGYECFRGPSALIFTSAVEVEAVCF